jgi:hypothetical protein
MGWRWRLFVAGLLLAFVLGMVKLVVVWRQNHLHAIAPTNVRPEKFDPAGWHSGSATRRAAMARQLTAGEELIGKSRAEITQLLGPPLEGATDNRLEWFLGERESPASLMFPYEEYLIVTLDDRGVCQRAEIFNRD